MTSNKKLIQNGDLRDGLIINHKGKKFVDIGINSLIPYFGKVKPGTRIAVKIINTHPEFTIKENLLIPAIINSLRYFIK